jgi:hypothetical protein
MLPLFKSYLLAIFIFLLFSGCRKFVQIGPPITQLVTSSVFTSAPTATAAQTVIYTNMCANAESFLMSQNNGLLADELTNYSTDVSRTAYYHDAMNVGLGTLGQWASGYNYIYQSNAIITGLKNNNYIPLKVSNQLTGESKFVRAFWYFYLINLYGDVPLITGMDYTVNSIAPRTPTAQVYQQVIADLTDAEGLLNNNYVDVSDTTSTSERVRPSKPVAAAMLARTYLYIKKYDSAEAKATEVINNKTYALCSNLDSVFLKNSSEAIWQLMIPLPASLNTNDGFFYILTSAPSKVAVSLNLLSNFEAGDNRETHWIGTYNSTTGIPTPYYFPNKYKVRLSSTVTEYNMVLRLAEQYLIRAEARAQQGNLGGAISDLNIIRHRAGLGNTSASTQADLLTAILHERQSELFVEWGHRWFDLIRTNSADSVMGRITPLKGGIWNPDGHQKLYPIPPADRNINPNLTQNDGY